MKKVIMFGLLIAVLASAGWAVPTQINLQGRLVDKNTGSPITGERSITFNLYTTLTGGTAVWTETQSNVVFNDNGIFNVLLGSKTALNVEFTTDYYYVGIAVAGDAEMTPRQRLVSVPYAYTAKNLEGGVVNARAASDTVTVIKGTNAVFVVGGTEYLGTGVRGTGKIGVSGFGSVAGGSFESTTGSGVMGFSATNTGGNAGVLGVNTVSGGWGVYGLSNYGYGVGGNGTSLGVWGTSAGSATESSPWSGAGVYGSSTRVTVTSGTIPPAGVYGTSLKGPGVAGVSLTNIGVYGKSVVAGGSFESTAGVGVYGKGTTAGGLFENAAGVGLITRSTKSFGTAQQRAGGYGEGHYGFYGRGSSEAGGIGVYGEGFAGVQGKATGYSAGGGEGVGVSGSGMGPNAIGVYAANYGTGAAEGTAFEIGPGKLKIRTGTASSYDGYIVGLAQFTASSTAVTVTNRYVNAASIIFITPQEDSDAYYWISAKSAGSFTIKRNWGAAAKKVGYLVIN
ncbi:MAG: hypothetical protein WC529_05335 [Candidatus Margulisiibacteriota bacterium]